MFIDESPVPLNPGLHQEATQPIMNTGYKIKVYNLKFYAILVATWLVSLDLVIKTINTRNFCYPVVKVPNRS